VEELRLPELGENIESADVVAVLVQVGDRVRRDQPLLEVETEKASLEVPSTADGTVREVLVRVGDRIAVGQTILRIEAAAAAAAAPVEPAAAAPSEERKEEAAEQELQRAPEAAAARAAAASAGAGPAAAAAPDAAPAVIEFPASPTRRRPEIGPTVPAAPSVRALARELGIDIGQVRGSGPGGRISRDDVKAHAKEIITAGGAAPAPALPDFGQWGEISREPLSSVRRATARAMAAAWAQVPHVTQFDRADVTQLESLRQRFNTRDEARGRKLTLTAIVIKMVAAALRQFPRFNASLDLAHEAVILKKYVHVGVAVDTERGLLVPVIRDVDRKSLLQIADELADLASRAREKKLGLEEMQGASFTLSNLGGLGTTYFAPIVNWPQVAILGVGRAEQQAVWLDGQFQPRLLLPLSVSYDHRILDGADAARFLRWLAEALEQPLLLLVDE